MLPAQRSPHTGPEARSGALHPPLASGPASHPPTPSEGPSIVPKTRKKKKAAQYRGELCSTIQAPAKWREDAADPQRMPRTASDSRGRSHTAVGTSRQQGAPQRAGGAHRQQRAPHRQQWAPQMCPRAAAKDGATPLTLRLHPRQPPRTQLRRGLSFESRRPQDTTALTDLQRIKSHYRCDYEYPMSTSHRTVTLRTTQMHVPESRADPTEQR